MPEDKSKLGGALLISINMKDILDDKENWKLCDTPENITLILEARALIQRAYLKMAKVKDNLRRMKTGYENPTER